MLLKKNLSLCKNFSELIQVVKTFLVAVLGLVVVKVL